MDQRERNNLDNYITGHYGEDQLKFEASMEPYYLILKDLRFHYKYLADHKLLLLMFVLEQFFEDSIQNIASDKKKLFHFSMPTINLMYKRLK